MIRPLTLDDTPAMLAMMTEAGLAGAQAMIARYQTWPSAAFWGWVEDGALIGSCGAVRQGDAAFVGAMAVRASRRGTGLGRRLLEHVHAAMRAAGCTTLLLEATALGEPLYAAAGYQVEHETAMLRRADASGEVAGEVLEATLLPALVELDRAATGVDRGAMLAALLDERLPGAVVHGPGGALRGYGLRLGPRLGPVIARDAEAGAALYAALLPGAQLLSIPVGNASAMAMAAAAGFTPLPPIRRMRLGVPVPVRPAAIWALCSAGVG